MKSLMEFAKANPEVVAQCAKKVRLEMNASYALGYRIDPKFGMSAQTEEPDYAAAADLLLEWGESFPERAPGHPTRFVNGVREHWEELFMKKWDSITEGVIKNGASQDEALVLAIWCEKLMDECLKRNLHVDTTPAVKYTFPCAVRVFESLRESLSPEDLKSSDTAEAVVISVLGLCDILNVPGLSIPPDQEPEAVKVWAEKIAAELFVELDSTTYKLAGICEGNVWEAGTFTDELHMNMWRKGYEEASGWPDEGTLVDFGECVLIRRAYVLGEYNVWLDTGDADKMMETLDSIFKGCH